MIKIRPFVERLSVRSRRRLAWTAPVVLAVALVAGVTLATAAASPATPTLPHRTATELLAAVQRSSATAFSGTVSESADLGLPSLPGPDSGASLSWQSFLTGTHTAKVWVDGPDRQRLALLGQLSEAEVVHNGANVWTYTSNTNTATHSVLPSTTQHQPDARTGDYTPSQLAAKVLKAVSPSTEVSVGAPSTVAGRSCYTLVIAPRDTRSTVRQVRIAIDSATYLPLQVAVYGAQTSPVLRLGFAGISFARPAASVFDYRVPTGARISTDPLGTQHAPGRHGAHHRVGTSAPAPATTRPAAPASTRTIGSGWTTVAELSGGSVQIDGTIGHLTTLAGAGGARLLHTSVLNAVLLPDGRAFVGAVSPTYLEHVAAAAH